PALQCFVRAGRVALGGATRPAELFTAAREGVDVEDAGIELDAAVEAGGGARLDAGDGGAVQLDVLDALVGLVRTLVVVHLAGRAGEGERVPSHDLVDGEE